MVKHRHQSRRRETREDYISLLPDCLLIEIISRLPDTREAIRTGTLSKRWQHLWPFVHNLIFTIPSYAKANAFYSFVDTTLSQCRQLNLHKFQINTSYSIRVKPQLQNWICYAVSRNVQHLNLNLISFGTTTFVLDQFMFINSCLTHLNLRSCEINPTGAISWNTTLSISEADLSEDYIQNILSGSPLLETLELKNCRGFRRIDITSKSVQNFVLRGYRPGLEVKAVLEINAPYIVSLSIADDLFLLNLLLVDVSCLVKAHLDYQKYRHFEETEEEMLKGLILSIRHVKELKIGESCLKVLSHLEANGFTFPSNMKVEISRKGGRGSRWSYVHQTLKFWKRLIQIEPETGKNYWYLIMVPEVCEVKLMDVSLNSWLG